jgi:hypothetical protein
MAWAGPPLPFSPLPTLKEPAKLRLTQALAAALWIIYGQLIHSLPVVVANLIVSSLAL